MSLRPQLAPRGPPPFSSGEAPPFRCCPRPGPPPQGRLAPQATPLSPGIAGRAGEEAAREGRAAAGGVSSSALGGDWLGRGEGAGLLPVSRGSRVISGHSSQFHLRLWRLRLETSDSGSGSMSDKRPAVDTQARRLPDSFKGEPRAPGEARGVARRSPSPPFGKGPGPKAPGISAIFSAE